MISTRAELQARHNAGYPARLTPHPDGERTCVACEKPIGEYEKVTRRSHANCYRLFAHRGLHEELPRSCWRAEDLVAEVDYLLSVGYTRADVVRAVGVQWDTIGTARRRLKKRNERNSSEAAQ